MVSEGNAHFAVSAWRGEYELALRMSESLALQGQLQILRQILVDDGERYAASRGARGVGGRIDAASVETAGKQRGCSELTIKEHTVIEGTSLKRLLSASRDRSVKAFAASMKVDANDAKLGEQHHEVRTPRAPKQRRR